MGFADTERNRAAVHEAGHALVAASRGLAVAVIELHGDDGAGGMRLRDVPSELDRIWVLYGGPFAEKVVFKKWAAAAIPPDLDELLLAHRLCRQRGISDTVGIRDQVEACLRDKQLRLELVAGRLLEVGVVEGAELAELLRDELSRT
ncbi:MAG: hypothetical protein WCB57_14280 [Pseudonocardiaceae bacterium]